MARKPDTKAATETLHEIESVFDRMAGWVTANPAIFFGGVGAALLVAGGVGFAGWYEERREGQASTAVARVEADFRTAMGATPGSDEIPEPANPEMARSVRLETIDELLEVAGGHEGTTSALRARLAAGNLQEQVGDLDAAVATWREAAEAAPADSDIRGLLLTRLGYGLEAQGSWAEAGEAHGAAAEIESFPARYYAMADAARCFAEAGEPQRAVALFDRLEAESPGLQLSDHVRARLGELRTF